MNTIEIFKIGHINACIEKIDNNHFRPFIGGDTINAGRAIHHEVRNIQEARNIIFNHILQSLNRQHIELEAELVRNKNLQSALGDDVFNLGRYKLYTTDWD